ncbi:inorganic phosphate transporter [Paracoccus jeotgali]|uniref:Phosphate transporter n=1 Tax=Paracoccus jeotgali TaxID=2065379 RepID=A0A2K9MGJ8_9RHOB|nr:inorganic phosphate transporter [Paracoccus jeotgali]AUM74768.1 inorganic phosphate transporter [Paracoccus jeotgali]
MPDRRDFRILETDLDRIGQTESAGRRATRPIRRLILPLMLALLAVMLSPLAGIATAPQVALIVGLAATVYLGVALGASEVANSLGPPVAANALTMTLGLALVAVAQLAGAVLAGGQVTQTVSSGLVEFAPDGATVRIMAAALIGAALWVTLVHWARAPVSTLQSIVGAVLGAGLVGLGPAAIHWPMLLRIVAAWLAAPLLTALLATLLLALLRGRVHFAADRSSAARVWLPLVVGVTLAALVAYLSMLHAMPRDLWLRLAMTAAAGLAGFVITARQLDRQIAAKGGSVGLKKLLGGPLAGVALLSGFAQGATEVAVIAGPLTGLMTSVEPLTWPLWALLLAALAVAVGVLLPGRRMVRMVGRSARRLNPLRAFCALLAASVTALGFAALGLPVSLSGCVVGGLFGIGIYRAQEDRRRKHREPLPPEEQARRRALRRSHLFTLLGAWAVTLLGAGLFAALAWLALRLVG